MDDDLPARFIELAADLLEPGVDALLNSGVLREIPLLGDIVKLASLSQSVSDRLLLVKLLRFVRALDEVSDRERGEFAHRMNRDPAFREKVGQTITLAIDRCNDLDKSALFAKALHALIRRRIEIAEFRRLMSAISAAYVADLHEFADTVNDNTHERVELLRRLIPTGLTGFPRHAGGMSFDSQFSSVSLVPEITELGQTFIRMMGDH